MPNRSTTPSPSPAKLLDIIRADFPDIEFQVSSHFSWHAGTKHISYQKIDDIKAIWALLHEIGHAELGHADFASDVDLLQKEVAAWAKAHEIAKKYTLTIDQDYIEDNLDSYRDWLHIRATCPTCYERCLQTDKHTYHCHNCGTVWRVTRSRLCRPYRRRF
jgi:hypothetical protein